MAAQEIVGRLATIRRTLLLIGVGALPVFALPNITHDPHDLPKLSLLLAIVSLCLSVRVAETFLGVGWRGLTRAWVPATALLIPLVLSWATSPYRSWALFGEYSRWQGPLPYAAAILLAILVADGFKGRVRDLLWAVAAGAAVVGGYGFVQTLGADPFLLPDAVAFTGSTIGNTNFAGGFLGMALPVALYLWFTTAAMRILAMVATVLISLGLIFTFSQGGYAAAAAGCAVVIAGTLVRGGWWRRMFLGAAAAIAGIVALAVITSASNLDDATPIRGSTAQHRAMEWANAVQLAEERPLLGWGPNSYYIEATRFRSFSNVITADFGKADDPHSVPLALLANTGLVGFFGFLFVIGWSVKKGLNSIPDRGPAVALFGVVAAYAVQAIVSIDEIPLRVLFWVGVGGLATTVERDEKSVSEPLMTPVRVAASGLAIASGIAGAIWSAGLIVADGRVLHALNTFQTSRSSDGIDAFEAALRFRDEYRYRELYSEQLGRVAVSLRERGAPYMTRVAELDQYLDHFPETIALWKSARVWHRWGIVDRSADERARDLISAAVDQDPNHPLLRVLLSEVLIDIDRPAEAVAVLEPLSPLVNGWSTDYWAALAIARAESGDITGAREAIQMGSAYDPDDCRFRLAREFVAIAAGGRPNPRDTPPGELAFYCDPGFLEFFLDTLSAGDRAAYGVDQEVSI